MISKKIIVKYLYIVAGVFLLLLGIIGVLLPVLPGIPFLLFGIYCFLKGSDKFREWFTSTKFYIVYLETLAKNHSMTLKRKFFLLAYSTVCSAVSFIVINIFFARVAVIFFLTLIYISFIFVIKTIPADKKKSRSGKKQPLINAQNSGHGKNA